MARLEELQELWQSQPPVVAISDEPLTRAVRGYGQRRAWINIGKLVAVAFMAGSWVLHGQNFWTVIGAVLVVAGALALVSRDWRRQQAISQLNFSEPSAGFVRSATNQIMAMRQPDRMQTWSLLSSMVVGMNLVLVGRLATQTPGRRFLMHAKTAEMHPCHIADRTNVR